MEVVRCLRHMGKALPPPLHQQTEHTDLLVGLWKTEVLVEVAVEQEQMQLESDFPGTKIEYSLVAQLAYWLLAVVAIE